MKPEVMTYDRDVAELKVERPVSVFPGDELIGEKEYIAVMSNTYLRKLPFAMLLMRRFSLPQNGEDEERIKRGLVCMGWLDHMLDEAPDRQASLDIYNDLVDSLAHRKITSGIPFWVRPEVTDSIDLLRNSLEGLPQKNKDTIAHKARRIGEISTEKAAQGDVAAYCAILAEEGALSSDVVIECVGLQMQNANGYPRLHAFNRRAMAAATILDAAIDLKQDYEDGLTRVSSSRRNHLFLYRKAFQHLPYIVKNLGIRGVLTMIKVGVN